jgi:uncharacterized protein (TIGR03437 family)
MMKSFALPLAVLALTSVSALAQTPSSVSVINYAGFTGDFPIAPGSIASAYGDFGSVTTTAASMLSPMPRELAGVRLRLARTDSPLYFVSRGQINFVVPVGTNTGHQTVEVVSGGNVVARGSVNVYEIAPGLASSDTTPARQGILLNQNNSVNSQSARARRGEVIQLYATGCGSTEPASQDGVPSSGAAPAKAPVKAYIATLEIPVQYAGAQPQFPAICQVNAVLGTQPFITGQVPITITVNGVPSNQVTLWVE